MRKVCKRCGKALKTWNSIQKGYGPICEVKYLEEIYTNQQVTIESLIQKKGERDG